MKHVSVIVPEGPVVLSSVVGAFKLFGQVNNFLVARGQPPYYEVELVGLTQEAVLYDGLFSIRPHVTIDKVRRTDLIVVTTIMGDMPSSIEQNKAFLPWISERHAGGAEVASLCMGAFLLAATGLLDGKAATTHWIGLEAFHEMFPDVHLQGGKIITEDSGIYTSGGAYSFLNLLLYLIEKYNGREMSIQSSKLFEIDIDRYTQSGFVVFQGQKGHGDAQVQQAQEYIEKHYDQPIAVDMLAGLTSLGKRNFIRRFKNATQNTPFEYVQRVRIEAAKKALESTDRNVNEVMMMVGYYDNKAFRSVFKKYTGHTPQEYRKKYNQHRVQR